MDLFKNIMDLTMFAWTIVGGIGLLFWKGVSMILSFKHDIKQLKKDQKRLEDFTRDEFAEHKAETERTVLRMQSDISDLKKIPERMSSVETAVSNIEKQNDRILKILDK